MFIWAFVTAVCAAVTLLSTSLEGATLTKQFEDLPEEPTYESACANWTPLTGQCVVLAAKNSRAKFISTQGGGVHTVYVSEALGHCPLLPSAAQLEPYLPEGVQVLIGTGANPDFRLSARPDVRQRLLDGCLPLVTTTWEDGAAKLMYEQLAFVRLIGNRLDVTKGDENSAAFVRLRVRNLSDGEQPVDVWLSICGSSNGQGRSVATYDYRAPLYFAGDRVVTSGGRVRVLWKAPPGAKILDHRLREKLPVPEEYGDYADTPVPGRELDKAFDKLFATSWTPVQSEFKGTAGIGLRFPEPRWVNAITLLSLGSMFPAPDGQEVQYFDGSKWKSVAFSINGKTIDELKANPEAAAQLGDLRNYRFGPVRADAIRLMITRMPPGKPSPAINSFEVTYSFDYDPSTGVGKWIDTGAGDPLSSYVHFRFPVPARGARDMAVLVPFLPADEREVSWLERRDVEEEAKLVRDYWKAIVHAGASFQIPERVVQEVLNANIPHIFASADIDPTNGLAILKANVGWYEAVWGNLAAAEIIGLDLLGYHKDAEQYLETFIKWQGKSTPPGNFKSKEGFLSSADEYTWVRWTSNHGFLLWALSEHYLLSGDRQWLDRVLPNILAACDWIERERARTKVESPEGTRPPEWGLMPPGVTGDGAPPCYSFPTDAFTWAGLNAAATLLREIGHSRAPEFTSAVDDYRKCILRAVAWATEHAPPYRLRSGETIPLVPIDVYNTWNITNDNKHPWWLDVGPLHLVDCGVVDPGSALATLMIRIAEDYWLKHYLALDEPWYAPQRAIYYGRDQINHFLAVYYNELAEGMDRQTYSPVEGHGGVQNLPWADGEHIRFVRMMLIREDPGALTLCPAIPRAWLEHGRRLSVREAPTRFGNISFDIRSDVQHNKIEVRISPPRRKAVPIRLRLRHPQGKPIGTVILNGKPHRDFDGEWVIIPAGQATARIQALY